ncbi:MAG TPA: ATP-binding protein [Chloroflexia bacterium]|nr:ATP-binding protein [Chloroflexia bacterium]
MASFLDELQREDWQRLAAKLEEQTRFLSAINSLSSAIGSAITIEELLEMALEHTIDFTGAEAGAIYLQQTGGMWTLAVSHNLPGEIAEQPALVSTENLGLKLILENRGPVTYVERTGEPGYFISEAAKQAGVQSWAGVPMSALDVTYGILTITSREYGAFSTTHTELLRVLGQLMGLAFSNSLAHTVAFAQVTAQLQDKLAELEIVLSSMSNGLVLCDGTGRIVRANDAAGRMLGLPLDEIVGHSVLDAKWNRMPDGNNAKEGPLARSILYGDECANCPIAIERNGETRILSVTASPFRKGDSERDGTVVVIRDVTEERQAEQMKEEFLSLLSHELRAPLTVISGYAQMLTRRLSRQQLTQEVGYAELIREHAGRMEAMVGDLVESGRLEAGIQAISKGPVDMRALVEEVVDRMAGEQREAPGKHTLTLSIDPDLPQVNADAHRIDQVLTNLLANAIKYSPGGGEIEVEAHTLDHKGEVQVQVRDRGVGVPESDRKRIFEHAYRGENGKLVNTQGLGLGLYICKLVVEAHGGHIGVKDNPTHEGSTFWFTLPIN